MSLPTCVRCFRNVCAECGACPTLHLYSCTQFEVVAS